jgi:hypothetical protein
MSYDRSIHFIRAERSRKLDAIEFLEAGRCSEGIGTLRAHIREIEQILDEAGEVFDA